MYNYKLYFFVTCFFYLASDLITTEQNGVMSPNFWGHGQILLFILLFQINFIFIYIFLYIYLYSFIFIIILLDKLILYLFIYF